MTTKKPLWICWVSPDLLTGEPKLRCALWLRKCFQSEVRAALDYAAKERMQQVRVYWGPNTKREAIEAYKAAVAS